VAVEHRLRPPQQILERDRPGLIDWRALGVRAGLLELGEARQTRQRNGQRVGAVEQAAHLLAGRSEERRVGKEGRYGVWAAQAEDGIRDKLVTGVQTCALPICRGRAPPAAAPADPRARSAGFDRLARAGRPRWSAGTR